MGHPPIQQQTDNSGTPRSLAAGRAKAPGPRHFFGVRFRAGRRALGYKGPRAALRAAALRLNLKLVGRGPAQQNADPSVARPGSLGMAALEISLTSNGAE
jgi:hypothetical protein